MISVWPHILKTAVISTVWWCWLKLAANVESLTTLATSCIRATVMIV